MTENDVIFKEIMSEAKNELDEKMKVFKLEYKQAFEKKYNLQPGDFEYLHKSCGKEWVKNLLTTHVLQSYNGQ